MLVLLERQPPMSNSASKEKTRRWRDHFLSLPGCCCFSDTASDVWLRRLLRAQKSSAVIKKTATVTGTAIAACKPELHDIPLQWFTSDTLGASPPEVAGALAAVPVGKLEPLWEGVTWEDKVEVARGVGVFEDSFDIEVVVFDEAVFDVVEEPSKDSAVGEAPKAVSENSVSREAFKLSKASALGPSVPVKPENAPTAAVGTLAGSDI